MDELNPNFAEHKMSNIISSFWMSAGTPASEAALELRFFGSATDLPSPQFPRDQLELMTMSNTVEHNIQAPVGAITAGTWYYAAAVYDNSLPQISLYFADASNPSSITPVLIGSVNPNWPTFTMAWLCLAAWPNPAGSCRDISGYIDAFSVAYTSLSPTEFYLLYGPPYVAHTKTDWQIYE